MDLAFDGQRVLVTGGARGIGRAVAEAMLEAGARVVITGRQPAPEWVAERAGRGDAVRHWQLDFARADLAQALEARLDDRDPFTACINNAGINVVSDVREIDPADLRRVLEINLVAPAIVTRAVARGMATAGGGRIVNVSSIYGIASRAGRASYSSSKAGLIGQTRAIALDLAADGVLVNCVAPGVVDSDLTRRVLGEAGMREMASQIPLGRLAAPAEIASAVCFLASRSNSYITGQVLVIDGGYLAR